MILPSPVQPGSPWLRAIPDPAAAARIFCLPPAGSGASVFDRWPTHRDGVNFIPVELPGRLTRFNEPVAPDLPTLATDMIAALEPWLDRRFAFFGHCWSAILAYELTIQLERRGIKPDALFVSSEAPPHWGPYGRMLDLDDAGLDQEIALTVTSMGKVAHPELIALYRGILRSDIELRRRYPSTRVPLSTPLIGYAWTEDADYSTDHLAAWSTYGNLEVVVLPGPHNTFASAPPALLDTLVSRLMATEADQESATTTCS